MNNKPRKIGFTLIELVVVMMIIALLVAVAIPSARAIRSSYESTGAEAMISSAFSSARAMAAKNQRYAGVRFQKAYDATKDANDWPQYMVFIVNDANATKLNDGGCRAVDGVRPVKLPENLGVMDLRIRQNWTDADTPDSVEIKLANGGDTQIDEKAELIDTTTFTILFSPTGKLVIHNVRVRNKDGKNGTSTISTDEVFNTENSVKNNSVGMFFQDDYAAEGLGKEQSQSSFVIYDKEKFKAAYKLGTPFTSYLSKLPVRYINQYTGTMIEAK